MPAFTSSTNLLREISSMFSLVGLDINIKAVIAKAITIRYVNPFFDLFDGDFFRIGMASL